MIKKLNVTATALLIGLLLFPSNNIFAQEPTTTEVRVEKSTTEDKSTATEDKSTATEDKSTTEVKVEESTTTSIEVEETTPTEERENKSSLSESKLKSIWTGDLLNVKDKHFYDALSIFFGGIINDENGKTMTFPEVLHKAEENSIEIETAKSKTNEASYVLDEVQTAKNLTVSGTANLGYSQPVSTGVHEWNWSAGISTNYLLSNFGKFEDQKKMAWLSYISAKMDEERLLTELYKDVSSSYLTVLELEGLHIVAQSSVVLRKEQMKIAKAKYEEGISPKYDMLTSLVSLKNAEQSLITAKKSLDLSKANLLKMMGMPQTETINVLRPKYISNDQYLLEDAILLGYGNRIEMSQIDLAIKIAQTNLDLMSKGLAPSLYWTNSYTRQNENMGRKDYSFNSVINFSIPIFDGGYTKAKKNEAKEQLRQAELSKESLERNIALQIKDAILQVDESKQKLNTAEAATDMAKEAYLISLVRYKENVGTYLELDDSTTGYLNALSSLSSAYCNYERAQINLLYSLGIIVEEVKKYENNGR